MDLQHFDLKAMIIAAGYLGLLAIVFAENGLFLGFFLPGDSLLFTAGFLASSAGGRVFDLPVLLPLLLVAGIAGVSVGYWFGQNFGRRLFQREDSVWFHRKHLDSAHDFYEKHGGKAIILARFLPVVRTFVPIVAGMALMTYPKFLLYNVIGGVGWVLGMTIGGYFLGSVIPDPDRYLLPIIALIIAISVAPTALHVYRENRVQIRGLVRARLGR
jgi:membrane-associated protein